ncbi:MAG TPA: redoxin domain-containing protein [Sphingobacterium sp.]|nr:redoxin domain-containing protein [Sphingobacterium sp.]
MKKNILSTAILSAALSFYGVNAQVSAKKGVTLDEIYTHLNALSAANDDNSKAEFEKEAKALAASNNESFVALSVRIYQMLEQNDKVEQVNKSILKKFPKGIKARSEAYNKIFENKDLSASQAEKEYLSWLKKFPENLYEEKDRGIFSQAKTALAQWYFKEGNAAKANEYVDQLKSNPEFSRYAYTVANTLLQKGDSKNAIPILDYAYKQLQSPATQGADKRTSAMTKKNIVSLYAKAQHEAGNIDKTITLLEELRNDRASDPFSPENSLILAQAYAKQGKELDAFLLLEKNIINNGKNERLLEEIESLYNKLNQNKGDFASYTTSLEAQVNDALVTKYKGEMIKKEAPNFSLVNMVGETINLSDLKGKVVVLDFWATWCGPCKISFPGMQAAVNKYKDDKEVEFLFIDTWQREENYKEVVEQFITENNYTFHVLFDEMKDKSKQTTTAYGVRGIPHKVVIDKEGFIRFESSGGSADVEKIVSEMETKIELARKG